MLTTRATFKLFKTNSQTSKRRDDLRRIVNKHRQKSFSANPLTIFAKTFSS